MQLQTFIIKFNTDDTHLVISDYPEKTRKGEKNYGIAWYTKQLIESLVKYYNLRFVVLAEKGLDNHPKLYQNDRILLLRIFDQRHFSLFPRILKWLITFNHIKYIDVHSEFCANGGIKNFILLLPFLLLIKLYGKNITYFSHNVVLEFNSIAPHLGLKKHSLKLTFLNIALKYYYQLLGILVDRFVVMDEVIYRRLSLFISSSKIFLNPFWIAKNTPAITPQKARQKLNIGKNEFILLFFGFVTHYKGADWLIRTVKNLKSQNKFSSLRLILAGGKAHSLGDKKYYQRYYQNTLSLVKNTPFIRLTGFVPEGEIATYFQVADLVVLPYRALIGGSGVLTHALSFQKPFIISKPMRELLENQKTKEILAKNGIYPKDIIFSHTRASFAKILQKAYCRKFRAKLKRVSRDLAGEREMTKLIARCYAHLYAKKQLLPVFPINHMRSSYA